MIALGIDAPGTDVTGGAAGFLRYRQPVRRVGIALLLAVSCAPATPDNASVARDYAEHRSLVEVTAQGVVTSVLADESGPSGMHQRFIIRLAGASQTVLVDNNVTIGQRAPVAPGDEVIVHGEYVWNDQGGLIHFTHLTPRRHMRAGGSSCTGCVTSNLARCADGRLSAAV